MLLTWRMGYHGGIYYHHQVSLWHYFVWFGIFRACVIFYQGFQVCWRYTWYVCWRYTWQHWMKLLECILASTIFHCADYRLITGLMPYFWRRCVDYWEWAILCWWLSYLGHMSFPCSDGMLFSWYRGMWDLLDYFAGWLKYCAVHIGIGLLPVYSCFGYW